MLVIPAIDIKDGKCVRLFQGEYDKVEIFSEDPVDIAKKWISLGAKFIHVVDLDGAKKGKLCNGEIVKNIIQNTDANIELGGGIRNESTIEAVFSWGVKRVVLGSLLFKDKFLAKKIFRKYKEKVIPSIDIKDDKIFISGWLEEGLFNLSDVFSYLEELGASQFIFTDIKRDGTLQGFDVSLIEKIKKLTNLKAIVGGGISSIKDMENINKYSNISGVIIGKALYTGNLDFEYVNKIYGGN